VKTYFVALFITSLLVVSSFSGLSIPTQKESQHVEKLEHSISDGPMDSPWPMFQHDPQHTGRSPYGPTGNTPTVKWKFWMDRGVYSSPSIDKNGTIYVGAKENDASLFAIKSDGTEKWHFDVGTWIDSSPAIAQNGTIYVGANDGHLYAFNSNGTLAWKVNLGSGSVKSSPLIDDNGIIYAGSVGSYRLCAVYPNGTIKWSFYAENSIFCSPCIDMYGSIYIGSYDGYLYAINPNGTLKWKYYAGGMKGVQSSPTIGEDGTVYFGSTSGYLYALYPNGTLKWSVYTDYIDDSSPAIDVNGMIYIGSINGRLYCIHPDGEILWHFQTQDMIYGSPAIDKNGLIYIGSLDGYIYALNSDGTLQWKFFAGTEGIISSPAISKDGFIYITGKYLPSEQQGSYTYLYALEILENEPPTPPEIGSPTQGEVGVESEFYSVSTDPDGDQIYYFFDWGDGTTSGWLGPFESEVECTEAHTYWESGYYEIKSKAKDIHGAESNWSYACLFHVIGPNIEILNVEGGFGVKTFVKNIGEHYLAKVNINISFNVKSGFIIHPLKGYIKGKILYIPQGGTRVITRFPFGFANVEMKVTVSTEKEIVNCKLVGPFVLLEENSVKI